MPDSPARPAQPAQPAPPALPTTTRGAATSRRILDAAAAEFAARGIAGARVDRIITAARTNKAQLYGYFGSKESLFDAVLNDRGDQMMQLVTFDAADLPAAAVQLYDAILAHPEIVRLITWQRLEQRPSGLLNDRPAHRPKLEGIAAAQAAGQIRDGDPLDLLALVIGMAYTWSPASGLYTADADEPAATHDRRRALLHESVRRALAPAGSS